MKRSVAVLVVVLTVLASAGAGVGAWLLARDRAPDWPQVSAYSNGQLAKVEPYLYCNVFDLEDCRLPRDQGAVAVNGHNVVQLSVDPAISRAPWRLLQVFENPLNTTATVFRPGSTQTTTVPTVDPQRGRLQGLVVQLITLVIDPLGQLHEVPHAEWAVRTVWN